MDAISLIAPAGSRISIKSSEGDPMIAIPADGGLMRYGVAVFVLCWLGVWFFGFRSALTQLLSEGAHGPAPGFLAFWLVMWTLGGVFALRYAYRLLRPSVPETLTLKFDRVIYDSGIPPLQPSFYYPARREKEWQRLFAKRTIVELDWRRLETLRLRETDSGNRLTVDADGSRLDLASAGSEIDREWIYQVLAQRYSLPISGAAPVGTAHR